ncbi:MAG: aldolase/citrate lyase family protein [Eubacterium sp.]
MPLTLMYITNNPEIAEIACNSGVDRIFIDMEYLGKEERQPNMDTVKNHHTVEDIKNIRAVIDKAELLVRINPINSTSKEEIEAVIGAKADIIMLPMWKTKIEVQEFLSLVNGRAKTMLLLETDDAVKCLDDVLALDGIDEIHIGLNDLSLSQKKKFLFEPLADGTVDAIAKKLKDSNIPFGFGGFGRIGEGDLPAEKIVAEHYRLGSSMAILSRSFCNPSKITDISEIEVIFREGIKKLREYEKELEREDNGFFAENHKQLHQIVKEITGE